MNQKVKRDVKDAWLCLNCGEQIVPLETGGTPGFMEFALFIFGLGIAIFVSLYFGIFLIVLSATIVLFFSGSKKKKCPSCENANLVPATSPAAQKFLRS